MFYHDVVADGLTTEGILGLDFLEVNKCSIDVGSRQLKCAGAHLTEPLSSGTSVEASLGQCAVLLAETIRIPPSSELETMA